MHRNQYEKFENMFVIYIKCSYYQKSIKYSEYRNLNHIIACLHTNFRIFILTIFILTIFCRFFVIKFKCLKNVNVLKIFASHLQCNASHEVDSSQRSRIMRVERTRQGVPFHVLCSLTSTFSALSVSWTFHASFMLRAITIMYKNNNDKYRELKREVEK